MRVQDFCRLGHEAHTGEDDDVGFGFAREQGQLEAVSHLVGHLLDFGLGVVVRKCDDAFRHGSNPRRGRGPWLLALILDAAQQKCSAKQGRLAIMIARRYC
ncbi:hypothetical protein D3C78_1297060 [compost metagenome]